MRGRLLVLKILNFSRRELAWAWFAATLLSGAPSTAYAWWSGGDPAQATWAAGAMLIAADSPHAALFAAAALVHGSVSAFWACVAGVVLPRRHTTGWAIALAVAIGWLDLRLIAPRWFPALEALAFWPQMADHVMWGACLGVALQMQGTRHPWPAG